jgi:predicted amidohydrolase YtcJ
MSKKKVKYTPALDLYAEVCALPKSMSLARKEKEIDLRLQKASLLQAILEMAASQGSAPLLHLIGEDAVTATLAATAADAAEAEKGGKNADQANNAD